MNQNLRIAVLAGRDPALRDDTDGGSVFLEYLLQGLSLRGAQVDVFIPRGVAGGRYDDERVEAQKKIALQERKDNVRLSYVPVSALSTNIYVSTADYFHARLERSAAFADALQGVSFIQYDVIYVLHLANAFFLMRSGALPPERTILFPMMTSVHYEEFSSVPPEYIEQEAATLRAAKHICSPSDDEIQRLINRFSLESATLFKVHRGFEPSAFPAQTHSLEKNKRGLSLLCANGIRPQKDHHFLIPMVAELVGLGVDVRMHLTGNNGRSHNPLYNDYTTKFWELVADRRLEHCFIAHDVLARSEMVRLIRECDLGIYVSRTETFGKSVLESIVSGLPTMVCDDVPAFKEFIKDDVTGIRSPREPRIFAKRIVQLVEDSEQYERLSHNGIKLRDQFTWKKVIDDLFLAQKIRSITV